jgi:hypothetical protein
MEGSKVGAPSYGQCVASLGLGLSPLFLLMGIASIFGANTVQANGQNVYGITGLIVAIVLNVIFAALLAGLQKLGFLILRLAQSRRSAAEA